MNIKFFLMLIMLIELSTPIMIKSMEGAALQRREKILKELEIKKFCLDLEAAIALADLPSVEEALRNGALCDLSLWKKVTGKQLPLYPIIELFSHESKDPLLKETMLQIIKIILGHQTIQSNITNSMPLKFVIKKQLQHNDYDPDLFKLLLKNGYARYASSADIHELLVQDPWRIGMSSDEVHKKMIQTLFFRLLERHGKLVNLQPS